MIVNVEEVLNSQAIDYIGCDKRLIVLCPFHDDHNPSGGIWRDSGYFKCFACGVESSLAEFLSKTLDISILHARRLVCGQDDLTKLEDRIRDYLHADDDRFRYFSVKSFRLTYPILEEGSAGWRYIRQRGITERMIRTFDMRSGVRKYHDRVVFPIYTPEGKLVSYCGRAVRPEMVPKTRKSRSPHRTLFGLYQVVKNFSKSRLFNIVVVEGEMDAIYLQQFGIPAVANMGSMEMSFDKIRLLRRYAKKVILSYDSDRAGLEAMYGRPEKPGQIEVLSRYFSTVSVDLPDGMDPNKLCPDQVEDLYGPYKN